MFRKFCKKSYNFFEMGASKSTLNEDNEIPDRETTQKEFAFEIQNALEKEGKVQIKPLTIAIVGCGERGKGYARFAVYYPKWLKVVAAVDPKEFLCQQLAKEHDIPTTNIFSDWRDLAKIPKLADAVAICTHDQEHKGPAIAFANLKYHILLEKPMSVSVEECVQIHECVIKNDIILAVGHVCRYTQYTQEIKRVLDSKVLGDIINIQHHEPIGYWHFAHSYVRGNWRNEQISTFSLLAKSCHDIDLLAYWMSSKCKKISSFGNLTHFKKMNKPKEAGDATNCLDCQFEPSCPYSAKKIYINRFLRSGKNSCWPVTVVQPKEPLDIENLTSALKAGNYGRCVYELDNDVCDNQVVNMEFENGATASFTMIAFTQALGVRKTRIFGTRGQLEGDGQNALTLIDFNTQAEKRIYPSQSAEKDSLPFEITPSAHQGGDFRFLYAFIQDCLSGKTHHVLSGSKESLDSHIYCFAAEHSRKTGQVVDIVDYQKMLGVADSI